MECKCPIHGTHVAIPLTLAFKILSDWKFQTDWQSNIAFKSGLNAGYRQNQYCNSIGPHEIDSITCAHLYKDNQLERTATKNSESSIDDFFAELETAAGITIADKAVTTMLSPGHIMSEVFESKDEAPYTVEEENVDEVVNGGIGNELYDFTLDDRRAEINFDEPLKVDERYLFSWTGI